MLSTGNLVKNVEAARFIQWHVGLPAFVNVIFYVSRTRWFRMDQANALDQRCVVSQNLEYWWAIRTRKINSLKTHSIIIIQYFLILFTALSSQSDQCKEENVNCNEENDNCCYGLFCQPRPFGLGPICAKLHNSKYRIE